MPDPEVGVGSEERNNLLPKATEEAGIAEHRGGCDRKIQQQAFHNRRIAQEAILQRGDRGQFLLPHALEDAAFHGGEGVLPEIVAVPLIDGLQEQPDLYFFQIAFVHDRLISGNGAPFFIDCPPAISFAPSFAS